ncbi:MAG TPA: hypothetical protein VM052_08385, partial [Candidatus Limnocylindrales bacterium]|nr:hypothetical protein [Candidatus Limnocylindrales bacterium]
MPLVDRLLAAVMRDAALRPPAAANAIASCEASIGARLPPALRAMYSRADGQPAGSTLAFGLRFLPLDEALRLRAAWSSFRPGELPILGAAVASSRPPSARDAVILVDIVRSRVVERRIEAKLERVLAHGLLPWLAEIGDAVELGIRVRDLSRTRTSLASCVPFGFPVTVPVGSTADGASPARTTLDAMVAHLAGALPAATASWLAGEFPSTVVNLLVDSGDAAAAIEWARRSRNPAVLIQAGQLVALRVDPVRGRALLDEGIASSTHAEGLCALVKARVHAADIQRQMTARIAALATARHSITPMAKREAVLALLSLACDLRGADEPVASAASRALERVPSPVPARPTLARDIAIRACWELVRGNASDAAELATRAMTSSGESVRPDEWVARAGRLTGVATSTEAVSAPSAAGVAIADRARNVVRGQGTCAAGHLRPRARWTVAGGSKKWAAGSDLKERVAMPAG